MFNANAPADSEKAAFVGKSEVKQIADRSLFLVPDDNTHLIIRACFDTHMNVMWVVLASEGLIGSSGKFHQQGCND